MSAFVKQPGKTDEYYCLAFSRLLGFSEEIQELIKDNKDIMELLYTVFHNMVGKKFDPRADPMMEFRNKFSLEVSKLCNTEPITLAKQQLFGCLLEVLREQSVKEDDEELKAMYARTEKTWFESDPWVNFENKKYRYSRFMMLKRKACYIVEMPETGEYLAMDVEKLQNGFDKMKIPLKVKDLAYGNESEQRKPPKQGGRKPTELEGLVFKTMCELIIANGEKKNEKKEEKVVELDPVAQAKLDKKKEANRKTRERKKAAKKAKKDSKAPEEDDPEINEKEGFKLEVVDEEAPPSATSPV